MKFVFRINKDNIIGTGYARQIGNILYAKGYTTEMLINYEPSMPILMNGGNNYLVNQKVKTSKVSILQVPTTQLILVL